MSAAAYAQRAVQLFLLGLIVLIYNPWGVAYSGLKVPETLRYPYLFLLFGFCVSVIVYVVLQITESGENWLSNVFRKPDENDEEDENKMQPNEVLAFIAYPLALVAFSCASDLMLKKLNFEFYGAGEFFNPFRNSGAVHRAVSNNGIEMKTLRRQGGTLATLSDRIMSMFLIMLSWHVFVFNYSTVAGVFFTDNWKAIGSLILALVAMIGAFIYHIAILHKGESVIPMGAVTTFYGMHKFVKVFALSFVGVLLIGYPTNPLLEGLRQKLGASGYWISIISSMAVILLKTFI